MPSVFLLSKFTLLKLFFLSSEVLATTLFSTFFAAEPIFLLFTDIHAASFSKNFIFVFIIT